MRALLLVLDSVGCGQAPDAATLEALHHAAHEGCFIANSVKTEVTVEPR